MRVIKNVQTRKLYLQIYIGAVVVNVKEKDHTRYTV